MRGVAAIARAVWLGHSAGARACACKHAPIPESCIHIGHVWRPSSPVRRHGPPPPPTAHAAAHVPTAHAAAHAIAHVAAAAPLIPVLGDKDPLPEQVELPAPERGGRARGVAEARDGSAFAVALEAHRRHLTAAGITQAGGYLPVCHKEWARLEADAERVRRPLARVGRHWMAEHHRD